MRYREVARKLRVLGCEELPKRGKGSHVVWLNPANGKITPVPNWGSKDLKTGTLHAIVRQLGFEWKEFQDA